MSSLSGPTVNYSCHQKKQGLILKWLWFCFYCHLDVGLTPGHSLGFQAGACRWYCPEQSGNKEALSCVTCLSSWLQLYRILYCVIRWWLRLCSLPLDLQLEGESVCVYLFVNLFYFEHTDLLYFMSFLMNRQYSHQNIIIIDCYEDSMKIYAETCDLTAGWLRGLLHPLKYHSENNWFTSWWNKAATTQFICVWEHVIFTFLNWTLLNDWDHYVQ